MTDKPISECGGAVKQIAAHSFDGVGERAAVVEECLSAARDGFEQAMKQYSLIGPSGMARMMLNAIRALSPPSVTEGDMNHRTDKGSEVASGQRKAEDDAR